VYFEPKNKLEVTMERYIENSQKAKGAIMFCVCRAKLSEGIDFKDELCRSVIFLGIPYVSKGDPFIIHKGNYLKKIKSPHASTWKFIEASKAINQGLGRTVRHANDYGSILLFDDRY
jgi:Rad3-related DNA helicase